MDCRQHTIISRQKPIEAHTAQLMDFELGPAQPFDAVEIAANRNWTLYCLEAQSRQAVFVELPDNCDLEQAAFAYLTQFHQAKRVAIAPLDLMHKLADLAPAPDRVVVIFSIGRCGSTLASRIFAEIPNVWSISEPDAFTNLVMDRAHYDPKELPKLIRAITRLTYRPPRNAQADTLVIKHRSQALFQADAYRRALPAARFLFLYRDFAGWCDSVYRFAQKQGLPVTPLPFGHIRLIWDILSSGTPEAYLKQFFDIGADITPQEDILAAAWAVNMEQFQRTAAAGMAFEVFSYDQLNNTRQKSLGRLLQVCDLDPVYLPDALRAYEQDSQRGTVAAQKSDVRSLSPHQHQRIATLLRGYPGIDADAPV